MPCLKPISRPQPVELSTKTMRKKKRSEYRFTSTLNPWNYIDVSFKNWTVKNSKFSESFIFNCFSFFSAKKRLIDSVVIPLTTQGSHWALNVRQALRFWRQNVRNNHNLTNNHGLVIQVEDQDGKALKPSQYIQQDSCHTSELDEDEKACECVT